MLHKKTKAGRMKFLPFYIANNPSGGIALFC